MDQKLRIPCEGRGFSSGPNDWMTAGGFDTKLKNEREIDAHLNRVNSNAVPANDPGIEKERIYKPEHQFKPDLGNYPKDEYAGPAMELVINFILNFFTR